MQTIDEAAEKVDVKFRENDPAVLESYKELCGEAQLLKIVLTLMDCPGGQANRTLQALCLGVLIGIESQR